MPSQRFSLPPWHVSQLSTENTQNFMYIAFYKMTFFDGETEGKRYLIEPDGFPLRAPPFYRIPWWLNVVAPRSKLPAL